MTCLHFLKKNGYVDGWAVNIWHVFIQVSKKRNKNISHVDGSAVNIWQLSNLSYVDGWAINIWLVYIFISWNTNILKQKHVICWRLSRQHNCSFSKVQTYHMLTAEPSTYDNYLFLLLETNRKTYLFFFLNANMSYVDGSAINIWHVWIDRAIW